VDSEPPAPRAASSRCVGVTYLGQRPGAALGVLEPAAAQPPQGAVQGPRGVGDAEPARRVGQVADGERGGTQVAGHVAALGRERVRAARRLDGVPEALQQVPRLASRSGRRRIAQQQPRQLQPHCTRCSQRDGASPAPSASRCPWSPSARRPGAAYTPARPAETPAAAAGARSPRAARRARPAPAPALGAAPARRGRPHPPPRAPGPAGARSPPPAPARSTARAAAAPVLAQPRRTPRRACALAAARGVAFEGTGIPGIPSSAQRTRMLSGCLDTAAAAVSSAARRSIARGRSATSIRYAVWSELLSPCMFFLTVGHRTSRLGGRARLHQAQGTQHSRWEATVAVVRIGNSHAAQQRPVDRGQAAPRDGVLEHQRRRHVPHGGVRRHRRQVRRARRQGRGTPG